MAPRPTKTKARRTKNARHVDEKPSLVPIIDDFAAGAFKALLDELDFVPKVIEMYRRFELKELQEYRKYYIAPSDLKFGQNFLRQEEFLLQYLPDRLYQATDTLVIEAIMFATSAPMRRSLAFDLYNSIFVRRNVSAPPLRDGRNEKWGRPALMFAVHSVLFTIKNFRNVTLATVAKQINALPREGVMKDKKRNLTDKHLQKLLQKHRLRWSVIKRNYQSFIEEKSRLQKTTK
jgi:hypothetical protein